MQTVYWKRAREIDSANFNKAAKDCELVCAALVKAGHATLAGRPPAKQPIFTDAKIEFEGSPGVEPFILRRVSVGRERDGKIFEFCKTHGMPYETAVLACLFVLHHHVGEEFSYSVDEKIERLWRAATQAISDTLGWSPPLD